MVMSTAATVEVCPVPLRVTADTVVPCLLPAGHAQHARTGGADNPEPQHHQGVSGGRVYVWTTNDAGIINTLRNAGFHVQCDLMAVKLAVVVTPEPVSRVGHACPHGYLIHDPCQAVTP